MNSNRHSEGRVWLGVLLVAVGGFWLLDNLNIIPYFIPHYLISWKTFLIGLGIYFIAGRGKPEAGIIMIAIGSVFLLRDLNFFDLRDVWHIFWPLTIIAVGISMIARRRFGYGGGHRTDEKKNSLDYFDDVAIFAGRERTIDSQNFRGGKLTAMFGGSEIDLRGAELSDGNNVLDVFVMFGGAEIIVPPDWTLEIDVFSLFGGFGDKRISPIKVIPNKDKVLKIKGFVMFGGGEIKLSK